MLVPKPSYDLTAQAFARAVYLETFRISGHARARQGRMLLSIRRTAQLFFFRRVMS